MALVTQIPATPLNTDQNFLTIVAGDDYNSLDGASRTIAFTDSSLGAASVRLTISDTRSTNSLTVTGTVTGTATITYTFALTAAQTILFAPGVSRYRFDVEITTTSGSRKVTRFRGACSVLPQYTAS